MLKSVDMCWGSEFFIKLFICKYHKYNKRQDRVEGSFRTIIIKISKKKILIYVITMTLRSKFIHIKVYNFSPQEGRKNQIGITISGQSSEFFEIF